MSFRNRHMKYPVNSTRLLKHMGDDIEFLRRHTAEEILKESPQLYGWTRFDDYQIILAFFKCSGNILKSSNVLGYSGGKTNTQAIRQRMELINTKNFLETARIMMKVGHFTKIELLIFLIAKKKSGRLSRFHVNIASAIVRSSIKKYKGKKRAAKALGISLPVINKWLSYED